MSSMLEGFCLRLALSAIRQKVPWPFLLHGDAAEEFIKGDPFVINGLVSQWRLVEWNAAFI